MCLEANADKRIEFLGEFFPTLLSVCPYVCCLSSAYPLQITTKRLIPLSCLSSPFLRTVKRKHKTASCFDVCVKQKNKECLFLEGKGLKQQSFHTQFHGINGYRLRDKASRPPLVAWDNTRNLASILFRSTSGTENVSFFCYFLYGEKYQVANEESSSLQTVNDLVPGSFNLTSQTAHPC